MNEENRGSANNQMYYVARVVTFSPTYIERIDYAEKMNPNVSYSYLYVYDVDNGLWIKIHRNRCGIAYEYHSVFFSPIKSTKIVLIREEPNVDMWTKDIKIYKSQFSNSIITTNSNMFTTNINSAIICGKTVIPVGTALSINISTNGGNTWDNINSPLNQLIPCLGGNNLVLKFNMITTAPNITPVINGYAAQVFS